MFRRVAYLLALALSGAVAYSAAAQEVLRPAKIQARASRRQPSLGLPIRLDGQTDPAVWFDAGAWKGADSLRGQPFWTMAQVSGPAENGKLTPVLTLCAEWVTQKPKTAVDIVYGAFQGGWYIAVCKKTKSSLGWKSIAFVIPEEGIPENKRVWDYSHSVNWLENHIGYNLFPKLPRHLQEIIEEMTASEHLCPFQEFDEAPIDAPDREVDYDWEEDQREMM